MKKVYLFDWGDTLMVDFPDQKGVMCDWSKIEAVEEAEYTLRILSSQHEIYVATNARDSSEAQIKAAFTKVGLSRFISGYFCFANLGIGKGEPEFFNRILQKLNKASSQCIVVGDSLENDVNPALNAGIQAVWFNPKSLDQKLVSAFYSINKLSELLTLKTNL
jgi:putative hydrolase of the HAD superfamily